MFCCPECLLGRRAFSVPGAAGSARVATAVAPPPAAGQRWLDVHCHVFNAVDLPAAEFVERTRLGAAGALALPALRLIVAILEAGVASAAGEAAALAAGTPLAPAAASASTLDVLNDMRNGRASNGHPPMQDPQRLLRDAMQELDPTRPPGQPLSDAETQALAAKLDATSDDDLVGWIDLLRSPRDTITGTLLQQFPAGADVMITPALVDYNRWLGISAQDDGELSSLNDQVAVMAAVSRRRAAAGLPAGERRAVMAPFAPFDPWRSIEDDTVLTRLQGWLESGQAVGVKVYPPMGFAALGNDGPGLPTWPEALQQLVAQKRPGKSVGAALDAELRKLYELCVALDAPLMAHCADSELASPGNTALPSPVFWGQALAAFPNLRVNLGHFGGVWRFAPDDAAEGTKAQSDEARGFATDIAAMMATYPNLYADIAYFDLALVEDAAPGTPSAVALEFIANLAQQYPVLAKRLMFGSDWIMIGILRAADEYAQRVMNSLDRIFGDADTEENVRWRNAASYLGLGQGDRTRARLAAFLGADAGLLDRFDPAT